MRYVTLSLLSMSVALFACTSSDEGDPEVDEQAVIVHFEYGTTDLSAMLELEDKLQTAIDAAGVGELDGHEIAVDGSNGSYYMYGPSADRLFEAVRPVLEAGSFTRGARVVLRYGSSEEETREKELRIGPSKPISHASPHHDGGALRKQLVACLAGQPGTYV